MYNFIHIIFSFSQTFSIQKRINNILMIICFLFALSFSIISPVKLNVGKNTITVSASQQIEIKEVQSQSYFLFPQPISKNVEITVESNGKTLGQINNENIGVYFGINSGQITFRLTAASASQDTIDFYYLSPSHHILVPIQTMLL